MRGSLPHPGSISQPGGTPAGCYSYGMTAHPDLVPVVGERFMARCQFCKTESIPVTAVDAAHAWADLEPLGWGPYQPVPGAVVVALCKRLQRSKHPVVAIKARCRYRWDHPSVIRAKSTDHQRSGRSRTSTSVRKSSAMAAR